MRYLILTFAIFAILAAAPGTARATAGDYTVEYADGLEDMPLMPGLSALVGEGVVFDKPGGRFIESLAAGDIPADDISAFYADMLPQLGWQQSAEGNYLREGETCRLISSANKHKQSCALPSRPPRAEPR